jgi:hypothetical protein
MMLFFKPCNHARGGQALWLNERKERTEFNIKTMGSSWNKPSLGMRYFAMRLFFLTIPKPLKQYTLF